MSLSPRLGMRLRQRHLVSGMVRVGVEASDRYRTSVRGPDTQPPLRPRSPPHPHSHRPQAQAATEKASALTRSATVTAKEQREAAKELAKREAELAEAEDMLDLFTKARAPATPPACSSCATPPANPNPYQLTQTPAWAAILALTLLASDP